MKLVISNIRCVPDIDFDDITKSLFELLLVGNSLRGVREVWADVDDPEWAVDEDGVSRNWFVYGFLCKSKNSYYKWDFDTWFPMVI
ncbi:MAG: hypothetical protein ACXADB_07845 [Candidatus Hermodarchaeia archaeon]|jgi:hypothetical protein